MLRSSVALSPPLSLYSHIIGRLDEHLSKKFVCLHVLLVGDSGLAGY